MSTKSTSPKRTAPRAVRATTPAEDAPRTSAPAEDTTKRISFPVKQDGTFDLDAMRGSSREALKVAIADPTLAASLGLTSTTNADDAALLTTITGGLYDGLSFVAVSLARRAGYSEAQAAVAAFTSKEKEMLAEPTAAVVNKYFPDFGGKYRDEIMLCLALVNVIGAKILLLRAGARMLPDGSVVIVNGSTVAPNPPIVPPTPEAPGVAM